MPGEPISLAIQRRQLTVMFCDLVGSTELAARSDPEDLQSITNAFLRLATGCIENEGGFVARYSGDGILAYFGYPEVHEDDAERAIAASLAILKTRTGLKTVHGLPLALRIGIATGTVIVGDIVGTGPSEEHTVVGSAANLAARLQTAAAPNAILVSGATQQLAAGIFEFRRAGPFKLKGFASDEAVWEVLGPKDSVARFQARRLPGVAPLVGRDRELDRLLSHWRRLGHGTGQVFGVVGEPGIGKSRLLHEFRNAIAISPHVWLEGGGADVFRNTPFHTVTQLIRRSLGRGRRLAPAEMLSRLEGSLSRAGVVSVHAVQVIAELLGIDTPASYMPITMSADAKRNLLLSTLLEWLLKSAAKWPTVLVVEDLHWVDPSSLEFLDAAVEGSRSVPLLLVYSTRDEGHTVWTEQPGHERVVLGRLGSEDCARIVEAAAEHRLEAGTVRFVAARADGVPFFAEELARLAALPDAGPHEIPGSLSDLLLARLDRLGPLKSFTQIASVLGDSFASALFGALCGVSGRDLDAVLQTLVDGNILVRRGGRESDAYAFRHSLIRDAAYETLLRNQRRALHRQAAALITELFPVFCVERPEVLAHHWTAACEVEAALKAWREAGRLASGRRAYSEAQRMYEQAVALLDELGETPKRAAAELDLLSALAGVLQITHGYSSQVAVKTTQAARRLAERGGDLRRQCAHVAGAWMAASSAGDYDLAGRLAEQHEPLARAEGSPEILGIGAMMLVTSRYRTGDLLGAEEAFKAGEPHFASPEFQRRPGAAAQAYGNAAVNAWILDDPGEAHRRSSVCRDISNASANPYERAFAQYMCGMHANLMGDPKDALDLARQSVELSDVNGYPQFAAISRIVQGRAEADLGLPAQGLARMREGLDGMRINRSRAGITMYMTWLAQSLADCGETAEGLKIVHEALQINPRELFFRPEGLRLRAELHFKSGLHDRAVADGHDAVVLAKTIGAKLLHARATECLAAF
jgi:class 3 adenylate cyclase/tetratricopeptide (TPR) repeat protein